MHSEAMQRSIVPGDRGAVGHAPENAMPPFRQAVELGATMFELDVHPAVAADMGVLAS